VLPNARMHTAWLQPCLCTLLLKPLTGRR
jgi:hypothetical protein